MRLFFILLFSFNIFAASAQLDLKSENDKKKFADKQFEYSLSHKANAGQTKNAKMTGNIIDNPALYKEIKKVAVIGLSVAFESDYGSKGDDGYGGIPAAHFEELANSILNTIYSGFEGEGFQVIKLDEVIKAPSYSGIDFGSWDKGSRYKENCWVETPLNSKWVEPDKVNSLSSGIKIIHGDTLKARAMARNQPFQNLAKEVGADAGLNIVVRIKITSKGYMVGWGPLKRGLVVDLIPATGDPRIIWSASLKTLLELDLKPYTFDRKKGLYNESWKYNLQKSLPELTDASLQLFGAVACNLKSDQQK